MYESGRTPMYRAKSMEDELNVGEIYFKLEGVNPKGQLQDRLVELYVHLIKNEGFQQILVEGRPAFVEAVSYFAKDHGLKVHKTKENNQQIEDKEFFILREESMDSFYQVQVYAWIGEEIAQRLQNEDFFVYYQKHHEKERVGLRQGFFQKWQEGVLTNNPEFVHLQSVATLDEGYLQRAGELLKNEGIGVGKESLGILAAFLAKIEDDGVKTGRHVLIFPDGVSRANIVRVQDEKDRERIYRLTKDWLGEYGDPEIEMSDAIENAYDRGFILMSLNNDQPQGVCIVVHTGFDHFLPTYHLAYLGTDHSRKGRGIGSDLLRRAVEMTEGNLSLHVDPENKGAQNLYEKMGFKYVYNRMLYKPENH